MSVPAPQMTWKNAPNGDRVGVVSFDSLRDYYAWLDAEKGRLNANNKKVFASKDSPEYVARNQEYIPKWYSAKGEKISIDQLEAHNEYQAPELAQKVGAQFRNKLQPLLRRFTENNVNLRKMRYNALGLGVFSFDRASIGLMRMRTGDTQPIDLHIRRMEMELGRATDANDLTRAVTTVKDVFAWFPPAPAATKTIVLYAIAGGNSDLTAAEMLYTGIALAEITDFLTENGYSVEVRALIGSTHDGKFAGASIAAKTFDQNIDKNLLLVLLSDPMFYRFNGFKGIIGLANVAGINVGYDLGETPRNLTKIMPAIAPSDTTSIAINPAYSEAAALAEVERIISTVTALNKPSQP
jgi:hypothetical protein